MRYALLLVAAACGHSALQTIAPEPTPTTTPVAVPPAALAPPDDATIEGLAHDLLAAYDRGDGPALAALLADNYARTEESRLFTRAQDLATYDGKAPHAPQTTRAWKEQHVFARGSDAMFVGLADEHEVGNDSHGNREYLGWYTMSWVRDGATWKAAWSSWELQRSALEGERDLWNENYKQAIGFKHEPNQLLVDTVKGRKPGTALDVAMGQGRNALYLASQGWKVTGVDISDEGIKLARAEAAKRKLALDTIDADVDAPDFDFGVAKWDLVTMIYASSRSPRIKKIAPSLKKGGLFVVEYFAFDATSAGSDGFRAGQIAEALGPGFEILKDEIVDGVPDWATDHAKLQRFVAQKK